MKTINLIYRKISASWQSKKDPIGEYGLLIMGLLLFCLTAFFLVVYLFEDSKYQEFLTVYLIVLFGVWAFEFIISAIFIYNSFNVGLASKRFIIFFYMFCLAVGFLIGVPVIVGGFVLGIIVKARAKKMDNIINWFLLLAADLIVFCVFLYYDYLLASILTFHISNIFFECLEWTVNLEPMILFLIILFLKLEIDAVNFLIVHFFYKIKIWNIDKQSSADTIWGNQEKEELQENIQYLRHTMWRFQLICLIVAFLVIMFTDGVFGVPQSDAVNVITLFTLFMLYWDKRAQWV